MHTTSVSLLQRLRQPDQATAWERFVDLYTPLLYAWARGLRLQPADAADLVQELFLVLLQKLPDFEYDRRQSFRGWMRTILLNHWRNRLVSRALELMQAEFRPATWKACWEFVVRGRPAEEVAAELGITVNAVYIAKCRVLRRLREELDGLLD